ncbi:MAG: hypothetical protein AAF624_13915 [Bacteroidota bacterium]
MLDFRSYRAAVLPLVVLTLAGCDSSSSSEHVRLFTNTDTFAADATVTVTLANDTDDEIAVHPELCGILPQSLGDGGWDAAPPFDRIDFVCTEIAQLLATGERVEVTFSLAELDDPAGTYRFKYGASSGELTSNTFQVTN